MGRYFWSWVLLTGLILGGLSINKALSHNREWGRYVFDENGNYLNNVGLLPAGCPAHPTLVLCATIYSANQVEIVLESYPFRYRVKSPLPYALGYPAEYYKDEDEGDPE